MDNDDRQIGHILSRREVLALIGVTGLTMLAGCAPGQSSDGQATSVASQAPSAAAAATTPPSAAPTATTVTTASRAQATATATGALAPSTAAATPTPSATATATTGATATRAATATNTIAAAIPSCIVRPEVTEGPYYVDENLNRSDIRADPGTGTIKEGALLTLTFNVAQIAGSACTPLQGAEVEVWHCDAVGVYSDVIDRGSSTKGQRFLRGSQLTDANGKAAFVTIYPGWYPGRAVHIHFKVRPTANTDFTSQLFFDDKLSDQVFAQAPYNSKGKRTTLNSSDGIYKDQLLVAVSKADQGYAATFDIGIQKT